MSVLGFGADYIQKSKSQPWPITIDGKFVTTISSFLRDDGIPDESISDIIKNAAETLSYGPNPYNEEVCQKTGIVIGKVQSGKTSNFITLSALAFDNGYDLVVILGGTKNPLVTQNRERIREYFDAAKEVLVLDTVDYRGEISANKIHQFIKMGKKVIIVALKNTTQITYVKDNVFKNSSFQDKPILIIDDEGDEASLNTLVKKGRKSATYSAIESLKAELNRHCFVSVTATPQANLLIDTLDILSPDFGILVDPGNGYCGLEVFHSDSTYTIEIPDSESSLLDSGIPHSFQKALAMFFVACAIQRLRGMKPGDKMSMLVHPSQLKADHVSVYRKVTGLINDWIGCTNTKGDIAFEDVRPIFKEAYDEYAKSTIKHIAPYESIEDEIVQVMNMCGKHIVNGDSVSKSADDIYDFNIYVGGTMLGRGLTLKGLIITYIIRTAKGVSSVDTVQQRARWFGYKTKYLDLCRIFAVSKILNEFQQIREHEEDLWDTVRQANMQGEEFKNMARIFVLSDNLRMTRTNVATTEKFTFSFWNKQKVFQKDDSYIRNNLNILADFKYKYQANKEIRRYGSGAPFTIIGSSFSVVYDEILRRFLFPVESKLNNPLVEKLKTLLNRKGLDPLVDVIWMRDDPNSTSKHPIRIDGGIPNYSVGRRPQDLSQDAIYLGDDYQFKKVDTMQLQIHMIEDTNSGIVSPTLALYLPIDVVGQLTNLVMRA